MYKVELCFDTDVLDEASLEKLCAQADEIFALKDAVSLSEHLKECFWYNGTERENLILDFLRN